MTDEDLTRVIVNLTPRTMAALEDAAALEGETRVDTINRAIQLYCLFVAERKTGERMFIGRNRWLASEVTWR